MMSLLNEKEIEKLKAAVAGIEVNGIEGVEWIVAGIIQNRLKPLAKELPVEVSKLMFSGASELDVMVAIGGAVEECSPIPFDL
jgi:hypothetical protein